MEPKFLVVWYEKGGELQYAFAAEYQPAVEILRGLHRKPNIYEGAIFHLVGCFSRDLLKVETAEQVADVAGQMLLYEQQSAALNSAA